MQEKPGMRYLELSQAALLPRGPVAVGRESSPGS